MGAANVYVDLGTEPGMGYSAACGGGPGAGECLAPPEPSRVLLPSCLSVGLLGFRRG